MMKREQIFLSKNFTVIESDIPFTLKFNIKDNTANSAEDVINFKSGWYIFDNNKLLPQYVDGVYNLPKYNCWIEFDETLGAVPNWYTCYINPKSVESLSSEVTELDPAQLAALRQDVQTNGGKVDSVKSSVDALQTSNHSDLGAVKSSVDSFKSDLLNGVPGTSEPLSFYLGENLVFTKEIRHLVSPAPFGYACDWTLFVNEVLFNGWCGIYVPYSMSFAFDLYDGDSLVDEKFYRLSEGCCDCHFIQPEPLNPTTVPYQLVISTSSGELTISFDTSVSHATRVLIFAHPIDVYS